ncbi:MAG: phosphotransacetylase [Clostridiales bacterium]|nr:phosphotransacetylase [Clostridiales bacterium]
MIKNIYLNKLLKENKKSMKKILLPEARIDERVKEACKILIKSKACHVVVLGKETDFDKTFLNKKYCTIIDRDNFDTDSMAKMLRDLRKDKGVDLRKARTMIKSDDYFSTMLLKMGYADGLVAGAVWTTGNTLKPALQIIKTKAGEKIVTGAMIMVKENTSPLLFLDVSLVENPTSEELSQIAISGGRFMYNTLHIEPQIAMLSYSTKGSANHELVQKVSHATFLAMQNSFMNIDGEMQVDSALDIDVAKKKGITSSVGGNANVLVFPDLNAGNISYKLVSRLGGYKAIGPIMLNFAKPVNDLSRGCTTEEIVDTVLITKLMCEEN